MKVTNREQILLGVLFVILLGYGFYKFIYIGQNNKVNELKANKDMYTQKLQMVKVKIASKNSKNDQLKILNAKILDKTDKLFPSIEQEKIIIILDKMLRDSKLKSDVLGFSEISVENAADDKSKDENNNQNSEEKNKNTTNKLDRIVNEFDVIDKKDSNSNLESNNTNINNESGNGNNTKDGTDNSKTIGAYKMQITLSFKGKYSELISFIKQVEDYNKKIIINNINLTATEGSNIAGNLVLEFYSVPKLNNKDYFKWDYKKPSGKGNPFWGSASSLQVSKQVITKKKENKELKNEVKSDFVMSTKPITSDLPTIRIGKAKDQSKRSYIYADNEGVEAVEFHFTKIRDKYFYRYKTSVETYPKDINNFIEFIPNGENILLEIYSQKRGFKGDLSGANIKIINDTNKSVVVNILYDDENKPRVNILKEKGNISVIRN